MKDPNEQIYELAEELEAIMLLEYHNKNHLAFGTEPARLNEVKRRIVDRIKGLCYVNVPGKS